MSTPAIAVAEHTTIGTDWTIDNDHSNVEFSVKHMMIATVTGTFESTARPSPSSPAWPLPQHRRLPFVRRTQVWLEPEAIDAGVVRFETLTATFEENPKPMPLPSS